MKMSHALLMALVAAVTPRWAQQPVFSTRTEIVRIDVLATGGGKPIVGLQAQDFEVIDSGVPQRIDRVLTEDASLEAWLLLDQSGSIRAQRGELEDAARRFLAQLSDRDRVGFITFRHGITLHFDLSPAALHLEDLPTTQAEGFTSLRDALAIALALRDSRLDRAMILMLSDGADTMSWLSEDQLAASVARSEAVIYPVIKMTGQGAAVAGGRYLQRLADQTGGRVVRLEDGKKLSMTFQAVLAEMKARYVLTYSPVGVSRSGWHDIRVRLTNRPGKLHARRGYHVAE
jgi:VWFA-related protein